MSLALVNPGGKEAESKRMRSEWDNTSVQEHRDRRKAIEKARRWHVPAIHLAAHCAQPLRPTGNVDCGSDGFKASVKNLTSLSVCFHVIPSVQKRYHLDIY